MLCKVVLFYFSLLFLISLLVWLFLWFFYSFGLVFHSGILYMYCCFLIYTKISVSVRALLYRNCTGQKSWTSQVPDQSSASLRSVRIESRILLVKSINVARFLVLNSDFLFCINDILYLITLQMNFYCYYYYYSTSSCEE